MKTDKPLCGGAINGWWCSRTVPASFIVPRRSHRSTQKPDLGSTPASGVAGYAPASRSGAWDWSGKLGIFLGVRGFPRGRGKRRAGRARFPWQLRFSGSTAVLAWALLAWSAPFSGGPVFAQASVSQVIGWGDTRQTTPAGLTNVVAVAAGALESLALKSDGTVIAWGYYGGNVPGGLSNVVAISVGDQHELALESNGTVVAWGSGLATNVPPGLGNIIAIAAGSAHSLALSQAGTMVAWGDNSYGQTNVPAGLSNVVAVAAGFRHSLALSADGTVVAWGTGPETNVPAGLSNVVAIAAGGDKGGGLSIALKRDGTVAAWGVNEYGQTNVPAGLNSVVAIAAGGGHGLALRNDGTVVGWGYDNYGQSDTVGLSNVVAVAGGGYYSVVVEVALSDRSLGYALNATNLVWDSYMSTNKAPSWYSESFVTHDGIAAAQSGPIADGQRSYLTADLAGPGTLTFWWKVSSQAGHDILNFYLDDATVPTASISGQVNWQLQTVAIPSGSHVARWTYSKDASGASGQDAGWVDQVAFLLPPSIAQQPANQSVSMGATVIFPSGANGSTPLGYQWLRNGTNLPGATSPSLILTNVSRVDSAVYALSVSNALGVAVSSNATLTVRVPQILSQPVLQPDGSFHLTSAYADGVPLQPSDLANLVVQATTNLTDWVTLTNALTLTNGVLQLVDPGSLTFPCRFYQILEN